jgi:hypothetical protein
MLFLCLEVRLRFVTRLRFPALVNLRHATRRATFVSRPVIEVDAVGYVRVCHERRRDAVLATMWDKTD